MWINPIYFHGIQNLVDKENPNFVFRLAFIGPTQLKEALKDALIKGLPYPILTVAEYMAVDAEGFCWGKQYR